MSDFHETKKTSLRASIAAAAGVDASAVTVTVAAGSVLITATIAVPAVILLPDLLRGGRWRQHLNVWNVLALGIGLGVYLLPFVLANMTRGDYSSTGLDLVLRENIERYVNPFDHKEPFYVYFYYVPFLFFPWTALGYVLLCQPPLPLHVFLFHSHTVFSGFIINPSFIQARAICRPRTDSVALSLPHSIPHGEACLYDINRLGTHLRASIVFGAKRRA